MDNDIQKIISEQLKKLPTDVKNAIVSVDYKTKLEEITKRQKLLIDQAGALEMETTLVMMGLESLNDFVNNLTRGLGLDLIRAKEVALDVSENIFKPIRESLRKINDEMTTNDEKEIPPSIDSLEKSDENLSRDQILNEIEDPSVIGQTGAMSFLPEIRPKQEITAFPTENQNEQKIPTLAETIQTRLSDITITPREIIETKEERKLPEIDKKKPSSGVDPYREPVV